MTTIFYFSFRYKTQRCLPRNCSIRCQPPCRPAGSLLGASNLSEDALAFRNNLFYFCCIVLNRACFIHTFITCLYVCTTRTGHDPNQRPPPQFIFLRWRFLIPVKAVLHGSSNNSAQAISCTTRTGHDTYRRLLPQFIFPEVEASDSC